MTEISFAVRGMLTEELELPQIDIITSVKQLITRLCKDNDDRANVLGDTLPADYVIQTASPQPLSCLSVANSTSIQ